MIQRLYRKPYLTEPRAIHRVRTSTVSGGISKRVIMVNDFSFDIYQIPPQIGTYKQNALEIVYRSLINHWQSVAPQLWLKSIAYCAELCLEYLYRSAQTPTDSLDTYDLRCSVPGDFTVPD